jgi:HK97 gp10 family phage protein
MAGARFEVRGLKELAKRANRLDAALRRKVYNRAMKEGGKIIKAKAAALVPVKTGTTRKSLVVRSSAKAAKGLYGIKITVRGPALASARVAHRKGSKSKPYQPDAVERYYRFQELGTKHHPAKPFLKPALESAAPEALETVKKTLAAGIEQALR